MSPTFHARLINVTKNVSPAAACSVTIFSIKNQLRRTSYMEGGKKLFSAVAVSLPLRNNIYVLKIKVSD